MKYKFTILGCGSSNGVPSIEDGWGDCDPNNSKNNRTRTSAFLEILDENNVTKHSILFDTSPDLRQQVLANNIKSVDAVLYTHAHADHIYGLDDLRGINRINKKEITCYASEVTADIIVKSFSYIFNNPLPIIASNKEISRPMLTMQLIDYYSEFTLFDDVKIKTTMQKHGRIDTMGFVINDKVGYATDFHLLPSETIEKYKNLDLLIISATVLKPHPSHATLNEVLKLIEELKVSKAIITHMSNWIDYSLNCKTLPSNVVLGHDGLIVQN